MVLYTHDVEAALSRYANEVDDLSTAERDPVIDLNAVNPLSEFREDFQNASNTQSEHKLSTTAGTDDLAYLQTAERGQYVPGYEAQTGVGIRLPSEPTGDTEVRWGYYEVDSNDDPFNGYYWGVDSTGIFIATVRSGSVTKVYQSDWNIDVLDGSDEEDVNPSNGDLDLSSGHIFQIEFTYYGYGPSTFSVLMDGLDSEGQESSRLVTVHKETFSGETSVEQTNLPIRSEVASGGTSNDAIDLFVGGRQFSLIGQYTTNNRTMVHYRDSLSSIDDTQWYPAISIQLKSGADVGSIDFEHVVAELFNFEASNDNTPKRWTIRRGVSLDTATWGNPSGVEGNPSETAIKVDTSATSIGDGSGNASGYHMDGGVLAAGKNQVTSIESSGATGKVTDGDVVTLAFRSQPGAGTGAVNAIVMKWEERW